MQRRFLCYGLILSLTAGAVGVPAQAFEITISDSYSISEEDAVQAAEDVAVQEVTDTSEEEAYQWYQVDVYSDGKTNEEILLMMDGVWYMSVTQIEYYTDYRLGKDNTFREYEEYATGGIAKAIEINQDACTAVVRGGYAQQLDHIYEYENELYFPVHQILPLMECACEVKENVLHIENAEVSLADALHDMNPEAIYFDAAAEFDGKAWANSLMVGSAYLFDSIGGDKFRLDRLIGLGNYEDYKTAATDYLTDYEVYQEVMDQRNSTVNLAAGVDQSEDAIDLIFDGYGFMELVHDMLENAGNESVFYEWIPEDIYGDITSWGSAADVSRTALEAAVNYTLMVRDHRDMLAAVYLI